MKPVYVFSIVAILCVVACTSEEFHTRNKGLQYKIISSGQSDPVQPGETLKFQVRQIYNDSVLSDTRDSIPFYQVYDSMVLSKDSWEIFANLRKGDSVIFKALTDSSFKNKWPPFAKKGEWLLTTLYVEHIFGVKEDFREDLKKELEKRRNIK